MICDERRDSIFLYAAGELEPAEMEALRAHLATGCPICAGVLAEAEATLAQMSLAIDPVEPSAQTGDVLMARIGGPRFASSLDFDELSRVATRDARSSVLDRASQATPLNDQIHLRRSRMRIFATALLSAAAAVLITSGIFLYATRTERAFFHSSNLQTVALTSPTQPQARGQVLWDRDHSEWHVTFFNLTPPPPGKEYELWFIPPGGKPLRCRTFTVDETGHQSLIVELPGNIGPIAAAAVTLEKQGGSDTPTMPIQLVGNVPG